jgi:hypothetical protein
LTSPLSCCSARPRLRSSLACGLVSPHWLVVPNT